VYFYDSALSCRGSKKKFVDALCEKTRIDRGVLLGATPLSEPSVAHKMSWAASRQTTRVEDTAYCLLGIFSVNMPLIYGEGSMAFRRLQEEIVRRSTDLTIFAWDPPETGEKSLNGDSGYFVGLFAPSPAAFYGSAEVESAGENLEKAEFSATNKGLRLEAKLVYYLKGQLPPAMPPGALRMYLLQVGKTEGALVLIVLRKVSMGVFARPAIRSISARNDFKYASLQNEAFYIMTDNQPSLRKLGELRWDGIFFSPQSELEIVGASPAALWDRTDCCFFNPKHHDQVVPAVLVRASIHGKRFSFTILCNRLERKHLIFNNGGSPEHKKLGDSLFGTGSKFDPAPRTMIRRGDMRTMPGLCGLRDFLTVNIDEAVFRVSVKCKKRNVRRHGETVIGDCIVVSIEEVGPPYKDDD
jgi:hypothetical protein